MSETSAQTRGVVAAASVNGQNHCGVGWTKKEALASLYKTLYSTYDDRDVPRLEEGNRVRYLVNIPLEGLYYAEFCYNFEYLQPSNLKNMEEGTKYWEDDWERQIRKNLN